MLMALAIAALAVVIVGSRLTYTMTPPRVAHASLRPTFGAYLGVYEPKSTASFEPIAQFAQAAGRRPDMAEYFSGWAEQFDTGFANTLHSHGIIPFVEIDPTDASIAAIAAGDYDDYLLAYADAVADFGHPVVVGFGEEMNAGWYPWGNGHVKPSVFVAAWRHLVTVFRKEGADNVTWLWTIEAYGAKSVASAEPWWPGPNYVTWVGIDGFFYRPYDSFDTVFGGTIADVKSFADKPVLLSETAVSPSAGQFAKIQDLFRGVAADQTLGLVWFDVNQVDVAPYRQDWRLEDSPAAEYSFRLGVRDDLAPQTAGSS
jgi:mannan endo-1,4-beta-mannosidase